MLRFTPLTKVAEYYNGNFINFAANTFGVYLIIFADGQSYIGKSNKLYSRLSMHQKGFVNNKNLQQLNEEFQKCKEYDVYLLTNKKDEKLLSEEMFIKVLKPTLNKYVSNLVEYNSSAIEEVFGCKIKRETNTLQQLVNNRIVKKNRRGHFVN